VEFRGITGAGTEERQIFGVGSEEVSEFSREGSN
jgi:hypothetical protein